jgi:hypothetical protein
LLAAGRKVSLREGIWTKSTGARPNASSSGKNSSRYFFVFATLMLRAQPKDESTFSISPGDVTEATID